MNNPIGPSAIQLGPMKSGTTSIKGFFSDHSNLNVFNISLRKEPINGELFVNDKGKYVYGNYLTRNLYHTGNAYLVPHLKNWERTPIIIPIRNPMERFESHLHHFVLKDIVSKKWKCDFIKVCYKFPNKYYALFDIKKIDEDKLFHFKAFSKGLYYGMLKSLIENIPEERFLFINTENLSSQKTLKSIVNHIENINGYKVNYDQDKTIPLLNSKNEMKKNFFKGFKRIIKPSISIKITDYSRKYLSDIFLKEHQKLMNFKPYQEKIKILF